MIKQIFFSKFIGGFLPRTTKADGNFWTALKPGCFSTPPPPFLPLIILYHVTKRPLVCHPPSLSVALFFGHRLFLSQTSSLNGRQQELEWERVSKRKRDTTLSLSLSLFLPSIATHFTLPSPHHHISAKKSALWVESVRYKVLIIIFVVNL